MPQRVNGAALSPWEHLHTITSCKNYILALTQQVQNTPSAVERGFPRSLYNTEQWASCSSLFAYACTLPLLWMHLRCVQLPNRQLSQRVYKTRAPQAQSVPSPIHGATRLSIHFAQETTASAASNQQSGLKIPLRPLLRERQTNTPTFPSNPTTTLILSTSF